MLKINYNYNNVSDLCRQLSRELDLTVSNNFSGLDKENENGNICYIKLPNDLQVIYMDYVPRQDVLLHRKNAGKESFFFRIDGISQEADSTRPSVFFGQIKQEAFYMATANKRSRIINIFLERDWLEKYFSKEQTCDFFKKSIFHKESTYHYEFLDSEYKRLVNEMLKANPEPEFANFVVQNRTMLILERFFSRFFRKFSEKNLYVKASAEELERLKMVEGLLIKDSSFAPPTIAQLAKISALSTTKLKSLFKEVYGLPIYQYFQKHRMQKAKAMMLSRKYTVRETARELGYVNLKDFVKAFQKTFDQLPEEIAAM